MVQVQLLQANRSAGAAPPALQSLISYAGVAQQRATTTLCFSVRSAGSLPPLPPSPAPPSPRPPSPSPPVYTPIEFEGNSGSEDYPASEAPLYNGYYDVPISGRRREQQEQQGMTPPPSPAAPSAMALAQQWMPATVYTGACGRCTP